MARLSVRQSLPIMGYPYEGIVQILEIVARDQPTIEDLRHWFQQRKESGRPTPFFRSGDDDMLYFVKTLLGLVALDGSRLRLSELGRELYTRVHTDEFGSALFRLVLEASRQRFTYFAHAVDRLHEHISLYGCVLETPRYHAILQETNKRSAKEIHALLVGCGVVHKLNGEVEVSVQELEQDTDTVDHILQRISSMVAAHGPIVYSEAIDELKKTYAPCRLSTLEAKIRTHLRMNATRTTEYIHGVLE